MPVNFGLLGAIPAPQVVASLPSSQPNNSVDSLAGGLMQGVLQGQQMQMNNKQMEYQDVKTQEAKIDLSTKEKAAAYADKLDATAAQGRDQYLKALRPEDRIRVLTAEAQQREQEAKARQSGADAAYSVSSYKGVANSAALQQTDPQLQQKVYTDIRNTAPSDIQELMPEKFDPQYAPIAVSNGLKAEATFLRSKHGAAGDTGTTATQKDAKAVADLQARVDANPNDIEAQRQLQYMKENQKNQRQVVDPFDAKLGEKQAGQVEVLTTRMTDTKKLRMQSTEMKSKLQQVPEFVMNPAMGWTGLQKLNPEFQEFNTTVQNRALAIKDSLYKLGGGQGFSNKDAERLEDIARGGIGAYKGTALEAINFMDRTMAISEAVDYIETDKLMKNSSNYEKWKELNPEPEVRVKLPDGQIGTVPASQLESIIKKEKAQVY